MHLGHLDVGQPDGAFGGALDDAAAEPAAAHVEREVRTRRPGGRDALRTPAADVRVEGAGAVEVAGVQLEVDDGAGAGPGGFAPSDPAGGPDPTRGGWPSP